jgi:hypothetical protein
MLKILRYQTEAFSGRNRLGCNPIGDNSAIVQVQKGSLPDFLINPRKEGGLKLRCCLNPTDQHSMFIPMAKHRLRSPHCREATSTNRRSD